MNGLKWLYCHRDLVSLVKNRGVAFRLGSLFKKSRYNEYTVMYNNLKYISNFINFHPDQIENVFPIRFLIDSPTAEFVTMGFTFQSSISTITNH